VIVLAVKALLAPTFVTGASIAARRFGLRVGGVVAGLPVVAGPILLVYALVHGRTFAQHAANGTLLGLLSLTAFVVVYGRLASHARWIVCMLAGWVAFAVATLALDGVTVPAGVALALTCAGFVVGLLLLPSAIGENGVSASGEDGVSGANRVIASPPAWDLPVRAACALVLVLVLTTASGRLGPQLSGLLATFPVITTVLAIFTHSQRGAAETVRLLRGMLAGFGAYAIFCFTLTLSLGALTVADAFVLATVAALIAQATMIARAQRGSVVALVVSAVAGLVLALCTLAIKADAETSRSRFPSPTAARADGAAEQSELPVTVTIDPFDPGQPVPQRFLGLSFEAAALAQLAQYSDRGNLVMLLRSLGPGVLRFGGITADENVAWTDAATPRPAWASSTIGPAQMHELGVLARRSGWQVLLTVGLAHYEPTAAAREVAAAHRALGPYLAAVEIGNEPDAYGNHGFRELPWIAQGYEEEVSSYREAIDALTPGVPIAGPDVSGSGVFPEWGEEEALSQKPALLTGHHYPLGCAQTPAPSIETLLSTATRGRGAQSLETYLSVSRAYDIPFRVDETNSVSCGGVAGISDTFASTLWATGYITQAMAAGAAGINLQGNPTNCTGYTPLCAPDPAALASGSLHAQPDWYALLLTSSLAGDRPLPTTITEGSPNLAATSFAGPEHSLKVVLADDEPPGASPLALRLNVGAGLGAGRILRLTAPSQSATGGVLLGSRAVAANGSWSTSMPTESVSARTGILAFELAPDTAALVTVSPLADRRSVAAPRPHRSVARRP
jgi:hypothetical protein